jgi:hypothetical protein
VVEVRVFGFLVGGLALVASGWAMSARALELVPGGYGQVAQSSAPAPAGAVGVAGPGAAPGLSLEFTPRGSVSALSGSDVVDVDAPTLRFDLTVRANAPQAALPPANATSHDALRASAASPQSSLTVGGAMHWSDWSVGGGLGRAHVLGEDVDLMAATLGYGRVSAEIAYGQAQPTAGVPQDVLMFSTDLAAWSWLTLESDLAVGARGASVDRPEDRNRDAVASGRLGLRLRF